MYNQKSFHFLSLSAFPTLFLCTPVFHPFTCCGFLLFIGSSVFILGLFQDPFVFPICSPSLYDLTFPVAFMSPAFFCYLYFGFFFYLTCILKLNNVVQPACLCFCFESFFFMNCDSQWKCWGGFSFEIYLFSSLSFKLNTMWTSFERLLSRDGWKSIQANINHHSVSIQH